MNRNLISVLMSETRVSAAGIRALARLVLVSILIAGAGCTLDRQSPLQASAGDLSNQYHFDSVQARIAEAIELHQAPSLVVAAVAHGKIVWAHAAGFADIDAGILASPDTVYRIGSVSKSLTASMALLAAAEHDIEMSRSLAEFPDWLGLHGQRIAAASLSDLLNMSAGLSQAVFYRGITRNSFQIDGPDLAQRHAVSLTSDRTRYSYSNMGPELVAQMLSKHTGESLARLLERHLLEPLAMTSSFASASAAPPHALARSYRRDRRPFELPYESLPLAGAGFVSSARDLARFALFHLGEPTAPMFHTAGANEFYGNGWGTFADTKLSVLMSDGQVNGGQAIVLLAPSLDIGVVVLSNAATELVPQIALATMNAMSPDFETHFNTIAEVTEARVIGGLNAFVPPLGGWHGTGTVRVGDRNLDLRIDAAEASLNITLDHRPTLQGVHIGSNEGFATWTIPCPTQIPACSFEQEAQATLALTLNAAGMAGVISIEGSFGLLPYEVQLQTEPAERAKKQP